MGPRCLLPASRRRQSCLFRKGLEASDRGHRNFGRRHRNSGEDRWAVAYPTLAGSTLPHQVKKPRSSNSQPLAGHGLHLLPSDSALRKRLSSPLPWIMQLSPTVQSVPSGSECKFPKSCSLALGRRILPGIVLSARLLLNFRVGHEISSWSYRG